IVRSETEKLINPLKGEMREINSLLGKKKQVILTGAPGTGKTYWAQKIVHELIARQLYKNSYENLTEREKETIKNSEQLKTVVMHSNYCYEDVGEGLRPESIDNQLVFKVKKGVFKDFALNAKQDPDTNYYLILDEIKRPDGHKIWGESIYSIEYTK